MLYIRTFFIFLTILYILIKKGKWTVWFIPLKFLKNLYQKMPSLLSLNLPPDGNVSYMIVKISFYLFGGKSSSEYGKGIRHLHQTLTTSVFVLHDRGTRFSLRNGGILTSSVDSIAFLRCSLIEELMNVTSEGNLKTSLLLHKYGSKIFFLR